VSNDLNQCQFIGRLGRDPETRYLTNGDAVTNLSLACGESWKDKTSGEKKETTEWVRCVTFARLAEVCAQYLKKGSQVYVSGKMKTRKYQDKGGVDRYSTEIIVDRMQMLGSSESRHEDSGGSQQQQKPNEQKSSSKFDDMADDIPF
jgi:single-strand DNA-binding protein